MVFDNQFLTLLSEPKNLKKEVHNYLKDFNQIKSLTLGAQQLSTKIKMEQQISSHKSQYQQQKNSSTSRQPFTLQYKLQYNFSGIIQNFSITFQPKKSGNSDSDEIIYKNPLKQEEFINLNKILFQ